MRSGTICCMSDFNANDKGVSPSESRRFKLTVEKPLLGSAIIVSKFKLQSYYKTLQIEDKNILQKGLTVIV